MSKCDDILVEALKFCIYVLFLFRNLNNNNHGYEWEFFLIKFYWSSKIQLRWLLQEKPLEMPLFKHQNDCSKIKFQFWSS